MESLAEALLRMPNLREFRAHSQCSRGPPTECARKDLSHRLRRHEQLSIDCDTQEHFWHPRRAHCDPDFDTENCIFIHQCHLHLSDDPAAAVNQPPLKYWFDRQLANAISDAETEPYASDHEHE